MRWADVIADPTNAVLRQFAGILALILAALGVRQYAVIEDGSGAAWLGGAAVMVAACGWFRPRLYKPVFVGWMVLAFPVAWAWSVAILGLLFFGLMTPIALAFRLIGRDPLRRRLEPDAPSYWIEKSHDASPERYLRQY